MYCMNIRALTAGLRPLYSRPLYSRPLYSRPLYSQRMKPTVARLIYSQQPTSSFTTEQQSQRRQAGSAVSWQGAACPRTVNRYLSSGTDDEAEPVIDYRLATIDDYEGIMSIGQNLFEGLDYLPATYRALSNNPSWTGICVLHEGKIVGFSGGHVVNGGVAMMLRGGRLMDYLRRQGILYGMMQYAVSSFLTRMPSVTEFYITFKSNSFFLQSAMYKAPQNQVFKRVGFNGAQVVDSGRSVIFRATRILPAYQRKSAMKNVADYHSQVLRKCYPDAMYWGSTVKSNHPLLASRYWMPLYNSIFQRSCVAHKFESSPSPRPSPASDSAVQVIDKDTMASIFNDPQNSQRLFVDGFINPRYVFMSPTADNIDLIYRLADQRLATVTSGGECTVLTLGVHFPCSVGYAYHIECYGSCERDDLAPHVHAHLTAAFDAIAASDNPRADLYVFTYGRMGDYDFSWLDEVLNARGAVKYELKYDHYVGLRNNVSDLPI